MNEKCPCCGSEMIAENLAWVCTNESVKNPCEFRIAMGRLPRIAAAMELARSEIDRAETIKKTDSPEEIQKALYARQSALKNVFEVFGGE